MRILRFYICVFLFLLVFSVDGFSARFYSVNSLYGISLRETNSVCEDESGFVWASSKIGILRLTNSNSKVYQLPYQTADVFKVKLVYKTQNLYAYTNNGQVFHYNRTYDRFELLTNLNAKFGQEGFLLFDMLIDDYGFWWLSTSTGIYRLKNDKLDSAMSFRSDRYIMDWYDDRTLVVGREDGIWLLDVNSLNAKQLYQNNGRELLDFYSVYVDKKRNELWFGLRSGGLYVFELALGRFTRIHESVLPRQPILSITANSDTTCLVGYDGQGIWELDRSSKKIENIYKEDIDNPYSLKGNGVYDLFCDKNNRVWVATYSGGLSFFDQQVPLVTQLTHTANNPNSIVNNDVNGITEDHTGKIWFATNNGISCFDRGKNQWRSFYNDKQTQASAFLTICEDDRGRIWAGSYSSGVYVLDGTSGKELAHYSKNDKGSVFKSDFISNIYKDKHGDIWLLSLGGNIICYQSAYDRFKVYPAEFVSCMTELPDDHIILGCSSGLFSLDRNLGILRRLTSEMAVRGVLVLNDDVWAATSGEGLIRYNYKTSEVARYTTEQGLPSNFVNSVLLFGEYLWIGTESGLSRFEPEEKSVFTNSFIFPLSRISYNQGAHCKLKNGQLAMGTNRGAVIFNPNQVDEISSDGRLFIQDLTITGRSVRDIPTFKLKAPIDSLQEISLRYFQNTIKIELISIGSSSGTRFSWKLDGFDQQWTTPSPANMISYTNLPSGDYNLKIRLYDSSLTEILDERFLRINLVPPFWQTFWFVLLVTVVITTILVLYFLYYIRTLKQKHTEEKIRFFTNTAHDIRTSLTLIKAPVEELTRETNISENGQRYLKLALEQSRQLSSVVTQLMDFQKVDVGKDVVSFSTVNLVQFVSLRKVMYDSLAASKGIELVFKSNCPEYQTAIDEIKMEKTIDNLISNAIKYSHSGGKVLVELTCSDKQWILEVKDWGIGISKKSQRQLFREFFRSDNAINSKIVGSGIGLLLVKKYVTLHGGDVTCESEENSGATFRVVVPFKEGMEIKQHKQEFGGESGIVHDEVLVPGHQAKDGEPENSPSQLMKVLVVEDNEDLLNFLSNTLSRDFKVFKAEDGAEAWDFITRQMPDLVISDVMMPNINGYELCRLLKSKFETSHIPIILLTALSDKEDQLHGLGLGADDYIVKPFDVALLKQRIKTLVRNREAVQEKAVRLLNSDESEQIVENELNDKFLKKMMEVVKANIPNSEFSKEMFASEMNMSPSLLYKKLKSLTNQSPTDFIRIIRLNHAVGLLQSKKYSVTEVSELSGFASVAYFSTVFRKHFGKSPTEMFE